MDFINRKNDPSFLIADFKEIFPAGHYVCCVGIRKVCNNKSVRKPLVNHVQIVHHGYCFPTPLSADEDCKPEVVKDIRPGLPGEKIPYLPTHKIIKPKLDLERLEPIGGKVLAINTISDDKHHKKQDNPKYRQPEKRANERQNAGNHWTKNLDRDCKHIHISH